MEPLLVLDQGDWIGYSCLARAAWIFATRLLLLSAATYFVILMTRFKYWGLDKFKSDAAPSFVEKKYLPYVVSVLMISMGGYTFYAATTHSRDTLYLNGTALTETGCYALRPYSETFDVEEARIEFQNFLRKGRDRSEMVILNASDQRAIVIDLFGSKFYANLIKLSPEVLTAYVQRLRKDREPVPTELQNL